MDFIRNLVSGIDRLRGSAGLPVDNGPSLRLARVFSDVTDDGVDWLGTQEPFRTCPASARTPPDGAGRQSLAPLAGETFVHVTLGHVTLGTVSGQSDKSRAGDRAVLKSL